MSLGSSSSSKVETFDRQYYFCFLIKFRSGAGDAHVFLKGHKIDGTTGDSEGLDRGLASLHGLAAGRLFPLEINTDLRERMPSPLRSRLFLCLVLSQLSGAP
jgi:hypothetical protein